MGTHSAEQLEKLLEEGKISPDDYETLKKALEFREIAEERPAGSPHPRTLPAHTPGFPWELPIVFGGLWFISTAFFLFVVPHAERTLQGYGARLPTVTAFVIELSNWIKAGFFFVLHMALFLIAAAVAIVVTKRLGMKVWVRIVLVLAAVFVVGAILIFCGASLQYALQRMPTIIKGPR